MRKGVKAKRKTQHSKRVIPRMIRLGSKAVSPLLGAVVEGDSAVDDSHVGCEELLQGIHAVAWHPVEGVAHGAAVGILAVADAAVAAGIVTLPRYIFSGLNLEEKHD